MLFTKFLYWFFKNLLALTLPLVIIMWGFSLNLPNSSLHSKILKESNFYPELNSEIQRLSYENQFPTKEGMWFLIVSSTREETATTIKIQELFEKNIALTSSWLSGQTPNWYFYLPTQQIRTSLDKNFDIKAMQVAKEKKSDVPACPEQVAIKYIIDLQKEFCFPKDIESGTSLMSDFVQSNLQYQGKAIQVLFNKEDEDLVKTEYNATEIGVVGESANYLLNNFRDGFSRLKITVNILLPILLLSLLIVPLIALALNKRPINEAKLVLRLLGISTLVNTLVLLVTSIVIFLQNLNVTGFRSEKIVTLFSNAFIRIMIELMTPAFLFSFAFIGLSIALYFVERLDFDNLRRGVIKFEEKILKEVNIKKAQ